MNTVPDSSHGRALRCISFFKVVKMSHVSGIYSSAWFMVFQNCQDVPPIVGLPRRFCDWRAYYTQVLRRSHDLHANYGLYYATHTQICVHVSKRSSARLTDTWRTWVRSRREI